MAKANKTDQSRRFEEAARELGVELDEEKLKRTLRRMKQPQEKKGESDENDQ